MARDAAGGVGRRAARGAATLFRDATRHCKTPRREDATLTAGFDPRRTDRPR